jgi:glucose/mannose-6-phosphate isomerase
VTTLDDAGRLAAADPGGMIGQIASMPAQLAAAPRARAAFEAERTPRLDAGAARDVLVCGMGGSAIGGDLAAAWAERHGVRIAVHRGYGLPAWAGPQTLLVFSSYSGNTEETLSAFAASAAVGAARVCLTTGGALAESARAAGIPTWKLEPGLQPRAALGFSLSGLLMLLHTAGLVPDPASDIEASAHALRDQSNRLGPEVPEAENPAKQLARRLHGKLPIVHTGSGILAPIGVRWRGQFQENAKTLAFGGVYPELDHNEIMGWHALPEVRRACLLLVLRDPEDPPPVRRRMEVTCEILESRTAGIEWIDAPADGVLQRMLHTVALGDWASVYLAFLNGIDPTPVAEIDLLKRRLAQAARQDSDR